jgi:hypothetical protein
VGDGCQTFPVTSSRRVHLQCHLAWSEENKIDWHFIAPGKQMQNGFCKSLNGRMGDELLNETLFFGLDHARHMAKTPIALQRRSLLRHQIFMDFIQFSPR